MSTDTNHEEKCPKCGSGRLTVYFMNGISRANDYACINCKHKFRYSIVKNKYYHLPEDIKENLDRYDD